VDGHTRLCLTAIVVLLAVLVVGLWAEAPLATPASAGDGFGDMGARIAAQLEAANKTNAKLDEIVRVLTSGQVKVQLVKDKDDKGGGGPNAPQPKTN
jgi:hypothetical protein